LLIFQAMERFFQDKVVVITGGSDGIGKALIELLIPLGAKIATCARNEEKLNAITSVYNSSQLIGIRADVSVYEDCKNFIDTTIKTFGGIDILINNAGISMRAELKDADVDVIKRVMDINFMGSVYCTKLALNSIVERKGTIVGISSIAGYRGLPGRSGYSASKFALNGWLEALRTELLETDVNVMWVCPGFTKSNIRNAALNENAQAQGESPLEEGALMSAQSCAHEIIKAVFKKKRTLILTFQGKQTVWLNKLFPSLTDKLTRKYFYKNNQLIK
jgi:short-subunit dehydrogenase